MLLRTLTISSALFLALPAVCQFSGKQDNTQAPPACLMGTCANNNNSVAGTSMHPIPAGSQWDEGDFKATDASVSCAVVRYDSQEARPILHLLCPGPDVFAPLRVHLALTWKHVSEIPSVMERMLVVMSRTVKFKSRPGNSRAELTLRNPQDTHSTKKWVTFTDVKVGLVLPRK